MPDESDRYDEATAHREDMEWIMGMGFVVQRDFLAPLMMEHSVRSVIEFGCGSGLLAHSLPSGIDYLGVDKAPLLLDKARKRNPTMRFVCCDVRNVQEKPRDLSLAFSFLKHFALSEWEQILGIILRHGQHAAFNVQIADQDIDNGVNGFPHVFVTRERLDKAVHTNGHKVKEITVNSEWDLLCDIKAYDITIWTSKRE